MIHILSCVAGHKIRSIKEGREREREVDQSQKGQSNYGGVFLKVLIKKGGHGQTSWSEQSGSWFEQCLPAIDLSQREEKGKLCELQFSELLICSGNTVFCDKKSQARSKNNNKKRQQNCQSHLHNSLTFMLKLNSHTHTTDKLSTFQLWTVLSFWLSFFQKASQQKVSLFCLLCVYAANGSATRQMSPPSTPWFSLLPRSWLASLV